MLMFDSVFQFILAQMDVSMLPLHDGAILQKQQFYYGSGATAVQASVLVFN